MESQGHSYNSARTYGQGIEVVGHNDNQDNHKEAVNGQEGGTDKHAYYYPSTAETDRQEVRQSPIRRAFTLLPFLTGLCIGILVTAAALGGGLGVTLSSCSDDKASLQRQLDSGGNATSISPAQQSSTTSTSPTTATCPIAAPNLNNYTVVGATQVQSVFLDCPAADQQVYTTSDNYRFTTSCDIDLPPSLLGTSGYTISHVQALTMYTWQDCVEACGSYNGQHDGSGLIGKCGAISFFAGMSAITRSIGGNCWLKNDTVAQGVPGVAAEGAISAMLLP